DRRPLRSASPVASGTRGASPRPPRGAGAPLPPPGASPGAGSRSRAPPSNSRRPRRLDVSVLHEEEVAGLVAGRLDRRIFGYLIDVERPGGVGDAGRDLLMQTLAFDHARILVYRVEQRLREDR